MESEAKQSEADGGVPPSVLDYSRLSLAKPRVSFGGQIMKAAAIGTAAMLVDAFDPYPRLPLLYGLLVWAIVIAASFLRHWPRILPEVPEGPKWRWVVVGLFLLTFFVPIRFHSCDHATTWCGMTHLGLSYSRTGGPCHNSPHSGGLHLVGNWYLSGLP